jgi:hypothetical protein
VSFQAVTWAIEQRAGSPSAKATLWSIANYANENWCAWPSQKTICEESEQSADAVQRRLPELEILGHIRRIPLRFAGRRTVDFCILAPSPFFRSPISDIEPLLPRGCSVDPKFAAADRGNADHDEGATLQPDSLQDAAADSGNGNIEDSAAALPQTLPQIAAHAAALERQQEPVMEPIEPERETRARGDDKKPSVKRFLLKWPTAAIDDKAHITRAWDALSADECEPCLDGIDRFLVELKKHGRKHIPAGWKYVEDRSWTLIDKPTAERANPTFDCWSKEWWAVLIARIERNSPTKFFVRYASEPGKHTTGEMAALMPTPERLAEFKNYASNGLEMKAWRPWFEAHGVNLPKWENRVWVFLPSPSPPNLSQEDIRAFD